MGLVQSVAVAEAHSFAKGLFPEAHCAPSSTVKKPPQSEVVIIPVDYSTHSERAFDWYVAHMHKNATIVRIIHCQEVNVNPLVKDPKSSNVEDTIVHARKTGKALIEKYEEKLQKHQIQGSVHSEFSTSPGELILSSVNRYKGTQIVMGSRGLGVIRRSILGSVSHYVLDHTHVPITIIPKSTSLS